MCKIGHYKAKGRVSFMYSIVPEKYETMIQAAIDACIKNERQVKKSMARPEFFETFINDEIQIALWNEPEVDLCANDVWKFATRN